MILNFGKFYLCFVKSVFARRGLKSLHVGFPQPVKIHHVSSSLWLYLAVSMLVLIFSFNFTCNTVTPLFQ